MDNKNIFKIVILFLAVILFIALANFIFVNCSVWNTYNNSQKIIDNCVIVKKDSINENQREMLDRQEYIFKKYLNEMDTLKKGIFDSNTITFMASFLLVFFGGLIFSILNVTEKQMKKAKVIVKRTEEKIKKTEERANEIMKKAEDSAKNAEKTAEQANESKKKADESVELADKSAKNAEKIAAEAEGSLKKANNIMDKLEVERNLLTLHTLLYTLFVLFANKNYFRLLSETKKILTDFDSGKYLYISYEWKTNFIKMIDEKMLDFLYVDKEISKEWHLHKSVEALEKLKEKISGLIVIE